MRFCAAKRIIAYAATISLKTMQQQSASKPCSNNQRLWI
jgi:hypothetical protein